MFSTIPTFSTNPYNPVPRLVHELGIIWDDARATKFETMKTRHLCSKAHSPRSRCRSQVSTNHLASGRCPRSAALRRAVCPDDCGRERESPQFVGMVERLKKLGWDWWKSSIAGWFIHLQMVFPFLVIQFSIAIFNCQGVSDSWKRWKSETQSKEVDLCENGCCQFLSIKLKWWFGSMPYVRTNPSREEYNLS